MPPSSTIAPPPRASPPAPARAPTARRRRTAPPPWLLTALLAALWLLVDPPSPDLPAHEFRADLFAREGFAIWNNGWYGGHHVPGYSVLFPPLAALLSPQAAAALATVVTTWCFQRLATNHWGPRARWGVLWFAVAAVTPLVAGQLAFAFALPFAFGALLAGQTGHRTAAVLLAALTPLASPVAALFLALAAAAWLITARSRLALAVLAATILPGLLLALAFPEGGVQPYEAADALSLAVAMSAVLLLLPREERVLRVGLALYVVAILGAGLLDTPVGGNVIRLGVLCAGPVLLAALWGRRPGWVLVLVSAPLALWQLAAPVRNVSRAAGDPSREAAYFAPLVAELDARAAAEGPGRLEIPFTRSHWEAHRIPPRHPQARGWERQLDVGRNGLFYADAPLTAARYREWIREQAVRWVAVPDVPLDGSAEQELELVRSGRLPWLRPVWRNDDWTLYGVRDPRPLADGAVTVTRVGSDAAGLRARRAGSGVVRVRWTPHWRLQGLPGCVAPAGAWTRVTVRRSGEGRLVTRFAPGRVGSRAPRCSAR